MSKYVAQSSYDDYDGEGYYNGTVAYESILENATASYDALGRITAITDPGDAANKRPSFSLTKRYDAVGNVRAVVATHDNIAANQSLSGVTTDSYWYKYDNLNRIVTTKGTLHNGAIVRGAGVDISYDASGQRATSTQAVELIATYTREVWNPGIQEYVTKTFTTPYSGARRETYAYTADGYVSSVAIAETGYSVTAFGPVVVTVLGLPATGTPRTSDTRDAMGRVLTHSEYATDGTSIVYQRTAAYNAASQLTSDSTSGTAGTSSTNYTYGTAGSYANGAVVSQSGSSTVSGSTTNSTITNAYTWRDAALLSLITNQQSGGVNGTTTSTFNYNANAHLTYVTTTGAQAKNISYTTDSVGQVMVRTQTTNGSTTSPRQFGFFFNGVRVGEIGNNGTDNVDYATTIANNGTVGGSGPFRGGATSGTAFADFDANYAAINTSAASEAGAEARYTVRPGDTLASIAQTLWGDASLWYMLAEANGLSATSSLSAGQSLIAPAKVTNLHNNSQTFKPYDAGKAIGDVQPGAPVPPPAKSGGCGALGSVKALGKGVGESVPTRSAFTERYLTESGGRFGSTTTRELNYGISQKLDSRGYTPADRPGGGIGREEYIPGAGPGAKGGTYVDITAIAPNGRTVRIQTIDTLANGLPTPNEAAAAARIRAAFPKDKLILVPKGK